jgi:hypothetical protein
MVLTNTCQQVFTQNLQNGPNHRWEWTKEAGRDKSYCLTLYVFAGALIPNSKVSVEMSYHLILLLL